MTVNGKVINAIEDTGSGHTLFQESTTKRVGGVIDFRRNPPRLQGVTGAPLRILSMWKAEIGIGDHRKCQRYFPIVTRVQTSPVEMLEPPKKYQQINLTSPIRLDPYHTQFVFVPTIEPPQTTLLIHPQPRFTHNSHPFVVSVTPDNTIYILLVNHIKIKKTFKRSTIVASYEKVEVSEEDTIHAIHPLHSDLIPTDDTTTQQGARKQRL